MIHWVGNCSASKSPAADRSFGQITAGAVLVLGERETWEVFLTGKAGRSTPELILMWGFRK